MCDRMVKSSLQDQDRETVARLESSYDIEVLEVANDGYGLKPTLINGRPVDRRNWPEVIRITVGNGGCTATLVGPNCAITAAHCGRNGATGNLELFDGQRIPFTVIQMPQYQNGAAHDLSLLKLTRNVSVPFAAVGFGHTFVQGQEVLLAGYGCTQPGGTGGNDGILRIGPSRILGFSGTDVVSEWRERNGAALCFGDSGGPMFSSEASAGSRVLVAVNSKGNIRDTNYNMRLDLAEVRTFLTESASREGLRIKGLNWDEGGGGGNGEHTDARRALSELEKEVNDVSLKLQQLRQVIG